MFVNIASTLQGKYSQVLVWLIGVFNFKLNLHNDKPGSRGARHGFVWVDVILVWLWRKCCTLLEIRVLQGFFTNTYNKPYPIGFFTLWRTPKSFLKTLKGFSQREKSYRVELVICVGEPLGFFHSVKKTYRAGLVICVDEKPLKNPYF
jgi:hypothetical protein